MNDANRVNANSMNAERSPRNFLLRVALILGSVCGLSPAIAQDVAIAESNELGPTVDQAVSDARFSDAIRTYLTAAPDANNLGYAAARIYRSLANLSADERYAALVDPVLKERQETLSTPVQTPTAAPPVEFARAIRQRPTENVFAVPQVGSMKGWLWIEYELVRAAVDAGRAVDLSRRIALIEDVEIRQRWSRLLGVVDELQSRAEVDAWVSTVAKNWSQARTMSETDILTLWLASESDSRIQRWWLIDWVTKRAHDERPTWATEMMVTTPSRAPRDDNATLKHWIADAGPLCTANECIVRQYERHAWLAGRDAATRLWLRYPIRQFSEIAVEPFVGGPFKQIGRIGFAERRVHAAHDLDRFDISDLAGGSIKGIWSPYHEYSLPGGFHRLSVERTAQKTVFDVNRHPMLIEEDDRQFPWVDLSTVGGNSSLFRNFSTNRDSEIAERIDLLASGAAAWTSPTGKAGEHWQFAENEIHIGSGPHDSVGWYRRPLAEGEQVAFDVFVDDSTNNAPIATPVVGRTAFLISSNGVRVRWLTDAMLHRSKQTDWTTLANDHELLEPLSRRGPAELKFNRNDWNRVVLKRVQGNIELSLNDVLIYVRKHEPTAASHFGIYAPSENDSTKTDQASLRLRNVVLTGEWPTSLPNELNTNAFARGDRQASHTADFAAKSIIKAEIVAKNYANVRRHLASLPPTKQFEHVERWLFPNGNISRDTLMRMVGYVPPSDPSPLAMADPAFASLIPNAAVPPRVIHPAVDWVQLANAHGFVDRVEARFAKTESTNPQVSLASDLLKAIASADFGSSKQLDASVEQLGALLENGDSALPSRWSYLAFFSLIDETERWSDEVSNLASDGFEKWSSKPNDESLVIATHWMRLIAEHRVGGASKSAERRRAHVVDQTGKAKDALVGGSRFNQQLRGSGRAKPLWVLTKDRQLVHRAGTELDYLMLRTPMPESYAYSASGRAFNSIAMLQEGVLFGADKGDRYQRSQYSGKKLVIDWTPPGRLRSDVAYHAVKQGENLQTFVNGGLLANETISHSAPPWLGFRAWWSTVTAVDHPSVTSEYDAPSVVDLTAPEQATFWSSYYQMKVGGEDSDWHWAASRDAISADENQADLVRIESIQRGPIRGTNFEGLLTYNRPLVTGEQVDYRFYFEPGSYSASPAIGRTVLYVSEDGVATHSVTDRRYDRTNVDPGNMRRFEPWPNGKKLATGWHEASVQLDDDRVLLLIDDHEVYQCPIDSQNDLYFGLFHYCDASRLRVSRIRLRGNWPAISEYKSMLGDPTTLSVEQRLADLPAKFEMDFVGAFGDSTAKRQQELTQYFTTNTRFTWTSRGLRGSSRSNGSWESATLKPRFELIGDFDIRLSFTDLVNDEPENQAGIRLEIEDDQTPSIAVNAGRSRNSQAMQLVSGAAKIVNPDGSTRYPGTHIDDASTSGTLRLVRVGNIVTAFAAPRNTNLFRMLRQQEVSPGPIPIDNISCQVIASGRGSASATFTALSIKAESMRYSPGFNGSPPTAMIARNLVTDKEHVLATSEGDLYHVGSPHISRDKKWVVFNRNDENPSHSHLEIVPLAGGTPPVRLGAGAVPRFSPDSQRIAFFAPREGVGYCNLDGSGRTIVSTEGRPADFPANDTIAYVSSGQIWFHNILTGQAQPMLTDPLDGRYYSYSWQINFGPTGRQVAVKGYRRDPRGSELAILDIDNPGQTEVLLKDAGPLRPQASWLNDGTFLIVGYMPGFPGAGLFIVDPKKPNEFQPFKYQPESIEPQDSDITADQEWVVVTGKRLPVPQEWTGRQLSK